MIDDVGYLEIFHKTLLDILETRRPDLIVFVSGADIYEGDRLGKLSISKKAIWSRDQALFQYASGFGASVATLMAGGYGTDIKDVVDIHFNTVAHAFEFWSS